MRHLFACILLSVPLLGEESEVALLDQSAFEVPKEKVELSFEGFAPPKKSPWVSVGLSALFPGFGHAYLGEFRTASYLASSYGASFGARKIKAGDMFTVGRHKSASMISYYGIYSSYRDCRAFNGIENYSYQMPTDSFSDLALASFQWKVIKKPEVWGGVLGALTLGVAISTLLFDDHTESCIQMGSEVLYPAFAFPVGIGEESFFRGFCQSALSESFNPTAGIIISSIAFGLAHIPNAYQFESREQRVAYWSYIVPFITGMGGYMGWLTYRNRSLKESVALHSWYDFAIFLTQTLASSSISKKPTFSISFGF